MGAFGGIRTPNICVRSAALYPLNYESIGVVFRVWSTTYTIHVSGNTTNPVQSLRHGVRLDVLTLRFRGADDRIRTCSIPITKRELCPYEHRQQKVGPDHFGTSELREPYRCVAYTLPGRRPGSCNGVAEGSRTPTC